MTPKWIKDAGKQYLNAHPFKTPDDHPLILHFAKAYTAHLQTLGVEKLSEQLADQKRRYRCHAEVAYPSIPGIVPSDGWMFARESVRQNLETAIAPLLELIAELERLLKECRAKFTGDFMAAPDCLDVLAEIDAALKAKEVNGGGI